MRIKLIDNIVKMPLNEIDVLRSCAKNPSFPSELYTQDIMKKAGEQSAEEEGETSQKKLLLKNMYKVYSGFSKYMRS